MQFVTPVDPINYEKAGYYVSVVLLLLALLAGCIAYRTFAWSTEAVNYECPGSVSAYVSNPNIRASVVVVYVDDSEGRWTNGKGEYTRRYFALAAKFEAASPKGASGSYAIDYPQGMFERLGNTPEGSRSTLVTDGAFSAIDKELDGWLSDSVGGWSGEHQIVSGKVEGEGATIVGLSACRGSWPERLCRGPPGKLTFASMI
jgi:hypothetical protein